MVRTFHRIPNIDRNRPRVDYFATRTKLDAFRHPSLLDPVDYEEHEDILGAVEEMKNRQRRMSYQWINNRDLPNYCQIISTYFVLLSRQEPQQNFHL